MNHNSPRFIYAGDRQLAVEILEFLLNEGHRPLALILPEKSRSSHCQQLRGLCPFLPEELIWYGSDFRENAQIAMMRDLNLDYVIGIHFPLIVPKKVLELPREGVLNLHPAFLPFNRGWHNSAWAMLDKTPYGATLHFMSEQLDGGDIVHQKRLSISPADTANSAYRRAMALELEVFKEAWPSLANRSYQRSPQNMNVGTAHKSKELYSRAIQQIEPDAIIRAGDLLDKLRALTTNRVEEAAYIAQNNCRYRYQVIITEEDVNPADSIV